MSGICGWYGRGIDDAHATLGKMADAIVWSRPGARATLVSDRFALAAVGPAHACAVKAGDGLAVAVHGHPSFRDAPSSSIAKFADSFLARFAHDGDACIEAICGDFALVVVDRDARAVTLAIDRVGVRNLVHQAIGETMVFGATADAVAAHPDARSTIAPQAIYDYVYFHMVPGASTVFSEHERLLPAHVLAFSGGRKTLRRYWSIGFDEPDAASIDALKPAFRQALRDGVAACADGVRCATFLSGGTDSSTVTGVLAAVLGEPPSTYSIGFAADGYDEMAYARIAAKHFASQHHEYYVTPEDVVAAVPEIARAYDQPFGNASAVPTYMCARVAAADGVERMLGGDGGDELFGGNSRYAKQHQLAIYERVPVGVRRALIEPALAVIGGSTTLTRKARSYVEQAKLPMPARYESYNLLERLGPVNVFSTEFLDTVDRGHPLAQLSSVYASCDARSLINRMLALDLKFTLADNDLPKVTRTCDLAGVDVAFPLLQEAVIAFSAKLPPRFKLRGTTLRYFFKRALDDFLPAETIAKEKHGFGLPAGPWLKSHPGLRTLAADSLSDLARRRIFRRDLLDALLGPRLDEHASYYGTLVWVLMMLEQWFAHRPWARIT